MTYVLRQVALHSQELISTSHTATKYNVISRETGGFMNKKPHMAIAKEQYGMENKCAEVRFDSYSSDTAIVYKESGIQQLLKLESSLNQRYECTIEDNPHSWQPTDSTRQEWELTCSTGKAVALFTYMNEVALTTGAGTGRSNQVKSGIIGHLHIMHDPGFETSATEQIICTALAVIERARRRAANVGRLGRGSAYKQGVGCAISGNVLGGGL